MSLDLCGICLKVAPYVLSVSEDNKDNKILNKLRSCVPEVEWNMDLRICVQCLGQLESVHAFRELCITSDMKQRHCKNQENFDTDELKLEETFNEYVQRDDGDIYEETYVEKLKEVDNKTANNEGWKQCYACYHCGKTFEVKDRLANHIKNKHININKPLACDNCGKGYTLKSSLKKHKSICLGSSSTQVDTLSEPDEADSLKAYNMCDICGTVFTNKYLLRRHVKNVHATEKKYECELCGRKFASQVYLRAHQRYHIGERAHICLFCGKGYITTSDLYHHEKIHENKRAYKCEKCPKAFNTSSDLHKHKICVHMDRAMWKYECSFCLRRFPLKTNLDTHTKTHTGEKNFLCHMCDRKCINQSVLKRHLSSHSIAKPFKCEVCLQMYKYQRSLDLHLAKVHRLGAAKLPQRIKKFFCTYCPKGYCANNKLQKHIRSAHTGERPFNCPACDKRFIDKSYIKQHLKTAHSETCFDDVIL